MTALSDLQAAIDAQTAQIALVVTTFGATTAALTAALANSDEALLPAVTATVIANTGSLATLVAPASVTPVAPVTPVVTGSTFSRL